METTVNQRIKLIIENSGLTLNSFSKLVGIAQTSLRDCVVNNAEPKYSTLDKIIKSNPSINPEWLLTGNGKMLLVKEYSTEIEVLKTSDLKAEYNSKENRLLHIIETQQRTIEKLTGIIEKKKPGAYMAAGVADAG